MNKSSIAIILSVIGCMTLQVSAAPEPVIPFEYAFNGTKFKWEGGKKTDNFQIREKWSSQLNFRYKEHRFPNISGDGSYVTEYLEIEGENDEMDYSYNQYTKYSDCDLDLSYWTYTVNDTIR